MNHSFETPTLRDPPLGVNRTLKTTRGTGGIAEGKGIGRNGGLRIQTESTRNSSQAYAHDRPLFSPTSRYNSQGPTKNVENLKTTSSRSHMHVVSPHATGSPSQLTKDTTAALAPTPVNANMSNGKKLKGFLSRLRTRSTNNLRSSSNLLTTKDTASGMTLFNAADSPAVPEFPPTDIQRDFAPSSPAPWKMTKNHDQPAHGQVQAQIQPWSPVPGLSLSNSQRTYSSTSSGTTFKTLSAHSQRSNPSQQAIPPTPMPMPTTTQPHTNNNQAYASTSMSTSTSNYGYGYPVASHDSSGYPTLALNTPSISMDMDLEIPSDPFNVYSHGYLDSPTPSWDCVSRPESQRESVLACSAENGGRGFGGGGGGGGRSPVPQDHQGGGSGSGRSSPGFFATQFNLALTHSKSKRDLKTASPSPLGSPVITKHAVLTPSNVLSDVTNSNTDKKKKDVRRGSGFNVKASHKSTIPGINTPPTTMNAASLKATPSMQDLKRNASSFIRGVGNPKLKHSKTSPNLRDHREAASKESGIEAGEGDMGGHVMSPTDFGVVAMQPVAPLGLKKKGVLRKPRSHYPLEASLASTSASTSTPMPPSGKATNRALLGVSHMPESCSFADLYAQLGIDPPTEQEDMMRTEAYFCPSDLEESCLWSDEFKQEEDTHSQIYSQNGSVDENDTPAIQIHTGNDYPEVEHVLADVGVDHNLTTSPSQHSNHIPHPWVDVLYSDPYCDVSDIDDGDVHIEALQEGDTHDVSRLVCAYEVPPEDKNPAEVLGRGRGRTTTTLLQQFSSNYNSHSNGGKDRNDATGYRDSQLIASSSSKFDNSSSYMTATASYGSNDLRRGLRSGGSRSRSRSQSPTKPFGNTGPAPENPLRFRNKQQGPSDDESDDDTSEDSSEDIPLAQRLPKALKVQKSLRSERATRRPRRPTISTGVARHRVDGLDNPKWSGEGGVPARELSFKLDEALHSASQLGLQAGLALPAVFEKDRKRSTSLTKPQPEQLPMSTSSDLHRHGSLQNPTRRGPSSQTVSRHPSLRHPHPHPAAAAGIDPIPPVPRLLVHRQLGIAEPQEWLVSSRTPSPKERSISAGNQVSSRKPSAGSMMYNASSRNSPSVSSPAIGNSGTTVPASNPSPTSAGPSPNPSNSHWGVVRTNVVDPTWTSQRVFFDSLQGPAVTSKMQHTTTAEELAGQVTYALGRPSSLPSYALVECFNEFYGAERPIRDFERVAPVMDGWNSEKRVNALVYKPCSESMLCTERRVPGAPPSYRAFVQYESKPGKWSKRFIEVQDGHVFIAKNDRGKEHTFLCSSSSFDVYRLTKNYKGPKGYNQILVLKSKDSPSMFEDLNDYMHILACDDIVGPQMFTNLFIARVSSATFDLDYTNNVVICADLSAHFFVPSEFCRVVRNQRLQAFACSGTRSISSQKEPLCRPIGPSEGTRTRTRKPQHIFPAAALGECCCLWTVLAWRTIGEKEVVVEVQTKQLTPEDVFACTTRYGHFERIPFSWGCNHRSQA